MIEQTLHRGGLTRADGALEGLVDGMEARFQRRQDDAIAASGGDRLQLAWLALRYGPERLIVNAAKGVVSLPRLYTSDDMIPGLAWAASNPTAASRAGYNAFSRLPTQDKVVSVVELLGPAALKFGPGALNRLNASRVLGSELGWDRGPTFTLANGDRFGLVDGPSIVGGPTRGAVSPPRFGLLDPVSPGGLGNAESRALSRGEELRQRYGHMSGDERRTVIWQRTEEIAQHQLKAMEASASGAHFMARHSPQVELYDQLVSAATGMRPDGKIMGGLNNRFTVDSTQFLSNKDMLYGINRAERIQRYAISNGNPINDYISLRFDYSIGEGFTRNTPMFGADLTKFYRQTRFANFGVDSTTGRAITAFPVLSNRSLGILY
jgi:hypothetical protein